MVFFEKCYVLGACKLTSLIRVQNQGFCHLESFFQRVYDHSGVQGIIYLPANNTTAIPVNDGCQIQEAVLDGDIGDVDCPCLIWTVDNGVTKQIRADFCLLHTFGKIHLWIDRINPHFNHIAARFPASHLMTTHFQL